ncbi:hypothetical protein O3M35_006817 [Rhynocoris fuscipes]|uniref:Uncharacterized protein n=1 Tax=Rhynocoris fuscipes TaxID=488301 RepID=A0AAW1DM18_9HEMI
MYQNVLFLFKSVPRDQEYKSNCRECCTTDYHLSTNKVAKLCLELIYKEIECESRVDLIRDDDGDDDGDDDDDDVDDDDDEKKVYLVKFSSAV